MVIDFEPEPILERVNYFRNSTESNEQLCQQLPIRMNNEWDIDRHLIQNGQFYIELMMRGSFFI